MRKLSRLLAIMVLAGTASLASVDEAQAWWGNDWWDGPWYGYPGYWGYPGWGYGYPGYWGYPGWGYGAPQAGSGSSSESK